MLGLIRTSPSRPKDMSIPEWEALRRAERFPHDGPTEFEPHVAAVLAELRAELTRLHHEDLDLRQAHRTVDNAVLALRRATLDEQAVNADTAMRVQAGRAARHQPDDPLAPHTRADGARAALQRRRAEQQRGLLQQQAEVANLALQERAAATLDRMLVVAQAAMPGLHRYVGLVNAQRAGRGLPRLENLPDELPERYVLDARRHAGDAPEPPHDPGEHP